MRTATCGNTAHANCVVAYVCSPAWMTISDAEEAKIYIYILAKQAWAEVSSYLQVGHCVKFWT